MHTLYVIYLRLTCDWRFEMIAMACNRGWGFQFECILSVSTSFLLCVMGIFDTHIKYSEK